MADKNNIEIPKFTSFTKTWHNKPYASISPSRPELSAKGKNVVVTGGGTGIGASGDQASLTVAVRVTQQPTSDSVPTQ